jgi:hypothetical protein
MRVIATILLFFKKNTNSSSWLGRGWGSTRRTSFISTIIVGSLIIISYCTVDFAFVFTASDK